MSWHHHDISLWLVDSPRTGLVTQWKHFQEVFIMMGLSLQEVVYDQLTSGLSDLFLLIIQQGSHQARQDNPADMIKQIYAALIQCTLNIVWSYLPQRIHKGHPIGCPSLQWHHNEPDNTSHTIVYSTIYSGADQRKHQSSMPLAFVSGIHRSPVNSPHKGPVTLKMFSFGDVIMWGCFAGCWCRMSVVGCLSWTQINPILPEHPCHLLNHFENLHRAWQ